EPAPRTIAQRDSTALAALPIARARPSRRRSRPLRMRIPSRRHARRRRRDRARVPRVAACSPPSARSPERGEQARENAACGSRDLEAAPGLEPGNNGFAIRRLTTWLCRLMVRRRGYPAVSRGQGDRREARAVRWLQRYTASISRVITGKWRNRETHRT